MGSRVERTNSQYEGGLVVCENEKKNNDNGECRPRSDVSTKHYYYNIPNRSSPSKVTRKRSGVGVTVGWL